MIIGIDGNEANEKRRVGIGEYAYQLLNHLYFYQKKIKNSHLLDKRGKIVIYLKNNPQSDLPKETNWWKYQVFGPKKLWTQFALPLKLFLERDKADVFFTPTHYAPRFSPCKCVISIMDLSFIYYPQMFKKSDLFQLTNWTKYSVRKAEAILTISHFSKKAIVDYYQIPSNKVFVTYPGYDDKSYKIKAESSGDKDKISKIKAKYGIDKNFLLFVGTLQPRKNICRLIEAFNQIFRCRKKPLQLVIVGKKGWLYNEIFQKVNLFELEKKVIFTGYIPADELSYLYQAAECFILVSLYEGFGLPVIEAMACGCPVIVSHTSSLPEVVGDAGIIVNPNIVSDITSAISKILDMPSDIRKDIVKKGLDRVKRFSWKKCAKETMQILESVVV